MLVTQRLGSDIQNYIKSLVGKKALVVGIDGSIIAASDHQEIGKRIELPENAIKAQDKITLTLNGKKQIVVPLKFQSENAALLLLNENIEELRKYIPLIKSFSELVIQQYYENNKPTLDSTDQFITKLLYNASPSEYPLYESEARVLGHNLDVRRTAIVVHLDNFWEKCLLAFDQPSFERDEVIRTWKRNTEKALNSFFTKSHDMITAYIGKDKFVVFKSVDENDEAKLKKLLLSSHKAIFEPIKNFNISDIVVGFGNAYPGVKGLIDSFREADLALELGSRLWGTNKDYYFGDLGILSVLADGNREKKVQFSQQLLSNLNNHGLSQTLENFFEQNLNLTDTAEAMGIHRNTVIYRLNLISSILGLDPRNFDQAVTIKIALLIKKLFT